MVGGWAHNLNPLGSQPAELGGPGNRTGAFRGVGACGLGDWEGLGACGLGVIWCMPVLALRLHVPRCRCFVYRFMVRGDPPANAKAVLSLSSVQAEQAKLEQLQNTLAQATLQRQSAALLSQQQTVTAELAKLVQNDAAEKAKSQAVVVVAAAACPTMLRWSNN
jgi:hypothetical protein